MLCFKYCEKIYSLNHAQVLKYNASLIIPFYY